MAILGITWLFLALEMMMTKMVEDEASSKNFRLFINNSDLNQP